MNYQTGSSNIQFMATISEAILSDLSFDSEEQQSLVMLDRSGGDDRSPEKCTVLTSSKSLSSSNSSTDINIVKINQSKIIMT